MLSTHSASFTSSVKSPAAPVVSASTTTDTLPDAGATKVSSSPVVV